MTDSKKTKQEIRGGNATFGMPKNIETFNDWYDTILDAADIADRRYPVKGCPIMRPLGFFMHNAIMRILEDKYAEFGVQQVLFPTLIPQQFLLREQEHIEGFKAECFWVNGAGDGTTEEPMALRPTSETAMYSMFSLWIRSFRDLPLKLHQTCTIFRYETKNTKPLIRIREIPWNEAHTAHATREDALQMIQDYWTITNYLFGEQLCFYGQKIIRAPWDQFPGAEHSEVLDVVMPCGKVLQTAGIHFLGQKFAGGDEPGTSGFNITFLDENNQKKRVEQTCCGISTRALACVIGIHGDDRGLVLPPQVAQYQIALLPAGGKLEAEVHEPLKDLEKRLKSAGYRVIADFSKKSLGEKIYFWEVRGIPIRIELGPRDLKDNKCVLTTRDLGKDGKQDVKLDELIEKLPGILTEYKGRLQEKAKKFHNEHVTICRTLQDVDHIMKNVGGFAKIPLLKLDASSQELEQKIKEHCGVGEIRGFLPGEICEGEKCIVTGEPATIWGYYAKAY